MKEFIEKLIGRLGEERKRWTDNIDFLEQTQEYQDRRIAVAKSQGYSGAYFNAIEIINQLAEEYKATFMEELLEAKRNCGEDSYCSECPFGQVQDRCYLAELQIEGGNNGWIPCSKELPPEPKENPLFDNKPLELYLVSLTSTDYPWRAFWNGKYFTDGFSKVEPIAWQPLPAPFKKGE